MLSTMTRSMHAVSTHTVVVHRHTAKVVMSTGTWLTTIRCTHLRAWTNTFVKSPPPRPPPPPSQTSTLKRDRTCAFLVQVDSSCWPMADGAGAAKRRRERRLRSWWRHERMSVAAALAEAHHHSALKVRAEQYYAPRRQKTASAGMRPGVLKDPAPQVAATYPSVTAPLPSLAVPLLAGTAGEVVDTSSLRYLTADALTQREEEERKRRRELEEAEEDGMLELNRRVSADLPLIRAETEAWRRWILLPPRPRKRKKKRKKRLPRTSSLPSRKLWRRLPSSCACLPTSGTTSSVVSRVRRRMGLLRQCYVHGWVFLVLVLALYSFLRSSGPRCSTPWPV